ncbi:hypothetical protein EYR27_19460 [Xanthomonas oryzae]|nr:hypothetical protein EYR27_19460 [Xanthomonas oryzae]
MDAATELTGTYLQRVLRWWAGKGPAANAKWKARFAGCFGGCHAHRPTRLVLFPAQRPPNANTTLRDIPAAQRGAYGNVGGLACQAAKTSAKVARSASRHSGNRLA